MAGAPRPAIELRDVRKAFGAQAGARTASLSR